MSSVMFLVIIYVLKSSAYVGVNGLYVWGVLLCSVQSRSVAKQFHFLAAIISSTREKLPHSLSLTLLSFTFPIPFPPIYLSPPFLHFPLWVSLLLSCSFPSISSHFICHLLSPSPPGLDTSSSSHFLSLFFSFFFVLPTSFSLLRLSSILSPTFLILAVSLSLKP